MIGKSLRERHDIVGTIPSDKAVALLESVLGVHARHIIEVRTSDANMIACVVVSADEASVRLCKTLGFRMKPGGSGVFGLLGDDAARLFGSGLAPHAKAWMQAPCAPRETKVILIAGGIALLSLETRDGKVSIAAVPDSAMLN